MRDGELRVEGRWRGVRGLRFLRPTLVVDDRGVLATLEHKPWAPVEDAVWTAAFPWTGAQEDLARAVLEVAPSVVVPLGPRAPQPRARPRDPAPESVIPRPRPVADTTDFEHLRPAPYVPPEPAGRAPTPAADGEPVPAPPPQTPASRGAGGHAPPSAPTAAALAAGSSEAGSAPEGPRLASRDPDDGEAPPATGEDDAPSVPDDRARDGGPRPAPGPSAAVTQELRDALIAAEADRDEQGRAARAAIAQRDRAHAQLEEAVRDRDAAMRTRDRLGEQRDAAITAQEAAERAARERVAAAERDRDTRVAAAQEDRDRRVAALERDRDERVRKAEAALRQRTAERDEARQERDRFREQRDEVLIAHRSLEKLLDAERAGRARGEGDPQGVPARRRASAQPLPPLPGSVVGDAAAPPPQSGPAPAEPAPGATTEHEVPLGIRAVPAARAAGADLLRERAPSRPALGGFDRWALRVLAITAAVCFLLLLGTLLQLFI